MKHLFLFIIIATTLLSCDKGGNDNPPNPGSGNGGGGNGAALFTLQGAGGSCSNTTVNGTYTQGTAVISANTLSVQVNVTTIGTWTVSTNTMAGISFAGSGNFAATGLQTVTLAASGTPNSSGTQIFTLTAGASSCTMTVNIASNATALFRPSNAFYVSYNTGAKPSSFKSNDWRGNENLVLLTPGSGVKVELYNMQSGTVAAYFNDYHVTIPETPVVATEAAFNAVRDTAGKPYAKIFATSGNITISGVAYTMLIMPLVKAQTSTDASNGKVGSEKS